MSRWLDWTEQNRTIWLATIARGEDIADPDIRQVVAELVRRAVALLAARHADIADGSPRLRYALECWTGLNRRRHTPLATRRGQPRSDARIARLDAGTRPAHLRRTTPRETVAWTSMSIGPASRLAASNFP